MLAASRGLLTPYVSPEAGAIPAEYRDADGHWTGTYLGVLGFCSNRGLLARLGVPVPESWDDLADPRLHGMVSAPNPVTSGTGYVWLRTQVLRLGQERAFAFVRDLDANVRQYTTSGLAPAGIAGRGEAAVAVTFTQHCVRAANAGMGDLVVSHPREGSGTEIGSVAILAGARAPAAARSYVDWALSRGAQAGEPGRPVDQLPTRRDVVADPRLGGGRWRCRPSRTWSWPGCRRPPDRSRRSPRSCSSTGGCRAWVGPRAGAPWCTGSRPTSAA